MRHGWMCASNKAVSYKTSTQRHTSKNMVDPDKSLMSGAT